MKYKKLDLMVFVFHSEEGANHFLQEMNSYQPNKDVHEFMYLMPLHSIVFLAYELFEVFDVAQYLCLMENKYWPMLPKCPLCIERIDGSVTGIDYSGQKVKSYGLNRWSEQRIECNVCRQLKECGGCCVLCREVEDIWICLVCGNLGCGRYKFAHAQGHYLQTNHMFSLEMVTGRLWDYNTDTFVHRLMVLNLPDMQQYDEGVREEDKVILEYCQLIRQQMEVQRTQYQDTLDKLKQAVSLYTSEIGTINNIIQVNQHTITTLKQQLSSLQHNITLLAHKQNTLDLDIQQQHLFNQSMKENLITLPQPAPKQQDQDQYQQQLHQLQEKLQQLYLKYEQNQ